MRHIAGLMADPSIFSIPSEGALKMKGLLLSSDYGVAALPIFRTAALPDYYGLLLAFSVPREALPARDGFPLPCIPRDSFLCGAMPFFPA